MTPSHPKIKDMWDDQADFNRLFRALPTTFEDRSDATREMVLHLMAQAVQLLECTNWRTHRRVPMSMNRSQVASQLTDIHKYWITLCQTWGFTFEDMVPLYWKKSMVCRQRYAEEWVRSIHQPTVILDLDNVLCDYVQGFGEWLIYNSLMTPESADHVRSLMAQRQWLSAHSMRMNPAEYQQLKHQFRTSGAKATLPVMPGAKEFVDWCRRQGWQIVVITSRPIDRYPNLYSDTLEWLDRHEMPVDFVWWGSDKGEKVLDREVLTNIQFVVDDDVTFVKQYADLGVLTYWLTPHPGAAVHPDAEHVTIVHTLATIMETHHV